MRISETLRAGVYNRGVPAERDIRIQIITSRVGGGHGSVALALAEAFDQCSGGTLQVWADDLYVDLALPPASLFPRVYAVMTRHTPWLWRLVFNATNRPPGPGRLELLGDSIGGLALGRLLAVRRPQAVVSVLPGVMGFVARSLRRRRVQAGLEVVVTDWADIHLSWISNHAAHYSVPTNSAAATCQQFGVPSASISTPGLPVRRQFADARPGAEGRRAARDRLGIPNDRFVVLAMIGTEGSAGALAHLAALIATPLDADIYVACGRHPRLRREVGQMPGPNHVTALGFVEQIADLMVAADLLVTKPGGVTLAEAFCCGLPVIAFDPLPGQEEGNVRYVVSHGAAELAASPAHLAEQARELRWSPPRRESLAAGGLRLARPRAALDVAESVVARVRAAGCDHPGA